MYQLGSDMHMYQFKSITSICKIRKLVLLFPLTLWYRIVVQDGISVQGKEFAILNKHTGSNKIVQAVFFVKKGQK